MPNNNNPRKGDWIQTYTGIQFWPLDPLPHEIEIEDIAHALSLICRYAGHCSRFYSVAQHSILVSHFVPKKLALTGLLHDASEAYISDIPKPVKNFLPDYAIIEKAIEIAIAERYHLPFPIPKEVKHIDMVMLKTEVRDLMVIPPADWKFPEELSVLPERIVPWSADKAELMFNLHFDRLIQNKNIDIFKDRLFN